MPETVEITEVGAFSTWTAKKGPAAGQEFHSYKVRAKLPGGEERDFEINRKPSSGPPPLGPVEAEVQPSNGNFPDKLKLTPQGRSNGSSGAKDDYWQAKEQRDIEGVVRMGRAHSEEMAIRTLAANGALGPFTGEGPHPTTASLRAVVKEWTDWFEQDLNAGSSAVNGSSRDSSVRPEHSQSKGEAAGSTPAPGATQPDHVGFVSKKQRDYWERLLSQSGWQSGEKATVTRYLDQTPKAVVSAAIDALKEGSEAEREGLLTEAANWAATQTDVPFDEDA